MKEIEARIEIEAPIDQVWSVLNDFGSYPQWNPLMIKMVGEVKPGAAFRATAKNTGGKEISFDTQLVKINNGQDMLFHSTYVKGLLYGDHFLKLEPVDMGRSRFIQGIAYAGIIRPLVGGIIRDTQKGMEQMNEALKQRCEMAKGRDV